jgi:hypothetical protein
MAALGATNLGSLDCPKTAIEIGFLFGWLQVQCTKNSFCIKANTLSQSLLMSNLRLGGKFVAVAVGDEKNGVEEKGHNEWACLRHAHSLVSSEPLRSILVPGMGLEPYRFSTPIG